MVILVKIMVHKHNRRYHNCSEISNGTIGYQVVCWRPQCSIPEDYAYQHYISNASNYDDWGKRRNLCSQLFAGDHIPNFIRKIILTVVQFI